LPLALFFWIAFGKKSLENLRYKQQFLADNGKNRYLCSAFLN